MPHRLHPWFEGKEAIPHLPVIREAVWSDRTLDLGYRDRDSRVSLAVLEPHGLVVKFDHWYLVAETPRGTRVYRVSRVTRARVLEETFGRRPGFDLERTWAKWQAQFVANLPHFEVTLKVSPEAERRLRESGLAFRRIDEETMLFDFQREDIALKNLLLLGAEVEIRHPETLRARVAGIARELSGLYSKGGRTRINPGRYGPAPRSRHRVET